MRRSQISRLIQMGSIGISDTTLVDLHVAFSDRRARWTLRKRKQCRGKSCSGFVGPDLLVNGEVKVGKTRQTFLGTENAQASDQSAGRKRGDREARERRRAYPCQTGAGIDP